MIRFGTQYGCDLEARQLDEAPTKIARIRTAGYSDLNGEIPGPYWLDESETEELIEFLQDALEEQRSE